MHGDAYGEQIMKLSDFSLLDPDVITVSLEEPSSSSYIWQSAEEAQLWMDSNEIWLSQGDKIAKVRSDINGLDILLSRKELPWLLLNAKGSQIHLQCAQPSEWLPIDEPLEICVDEKVSGQLKRSGAITDDDVSMAVKWCREQFIIEGKSQRLAALCHKSSSQEGWQILGSGWRADLQRDKKGLLLINRITRFHGGSDAWTLIQGKIRFIDVSMATQLMSRSQQAQLQQAVESNGSYIDLWQRYSEQEWKISLRKAAQLGVLHYSKSEANQEGDAWRFYIDPIELEKFKTGWLRLENDGSLALEVSGSRPDWLHASLSDLTISDKNRQLRGRPRYESNAIVIESDWINPPEEGYLYLSLAGDRTVQERRQKALSNIRTSARSLKLRYILQGVPIPTGRLTKYEALTVNARECFKHGLATDKQEQAIKMALETPDIALIIGPPGTGKTQVIAALSRRLSEISEVMGSQHQVLITSFQHDAVENALERAPVYDLPPVKIGQRANHDPIQEWCAQQYNKLETIVTAQSEKEGHVPLLRQLQQNLTTLRYGQLDISEQCKLLELVDEILNDLENNFRLRLPVTLRQEWSEYLKKLPQSSNALEIPGLEDKKNRTLKKIRGLRVTRIGFADDGALRVSDARLAIQISRYPIAVEDIDALESFEYLTELDEAGAVAILKLRNSLMDGLTDYRPPIIRHRLEAEGLQFISAIEDALEDKLKVNSKGIGSVLARYRDTFINHQSRSRETVREYAMVVGATCQQAASVAMATLKDISGIGDDGITFNTVIVDEAARANPLDLFIPMSMAKRRVILVGDHRQLPHLLEPDVEDELAETNDLTAAQRIAFKDSLFERLWRQLKDREAVDGFSRVVMLDTQFRMHPILGSFVSKQFYESAGLSPLKSGRKESDFMDKIPGYVGKICAWLDVPLITGKKEEKIGSSRVRKEEAFLIAKEVERLLKACGPEVSIGIITFYSAQRDMIFNALKDLDITERNEKTGEWKVADIWNVSSSSSERLRIGTVDAFQGKEFDIVLLSTVRSNDFHLPKGGMDDAGYEKVANRKYGHLRLSNRMNVAMSRQRSLLLIVGDSAMATGADAEATIPALADFLKLCKGVHGLVL